MQLAAFMQAMRASLQRNLVGIYLHGSLALGCFNPARSDLDLLVISEGPITVPTKRDLAQQLLRISNRPRPIEMSVLHRAQLSPWRYPTPFDFHYSESWRDRLEQDLQTGAWQYWGATLQEDPDLAAHITVTRVRGVRLVGEATWHVFPPVPPDDYRAALLYDVYDALDALERDPVYAILNTCRTLAFLREGSILSKAEGGEWALQHLPEPLRSIIRTALESYRSDRLWWFDHEGVALFERFARAALPKSGGGQVVK